MSDFLISQLLAGVALGCNAVSFQFKGRQATLIILTIAVIAVAAHLALLGEITGATLTAYAVIYFIVSVFTDDKRLMWMFMLVSFVIFYFTYERGLDFFVLISTVLTLLSIYSSEKKRMQEYQFFGTVTRIVYYSFIFSPVAIALELSLLVSNIIGYWRFYIRKQKQSI